MWTSSVKEVKMVKERAKPLTAAAISMRGNAAVTPHSALGAGKTAANLFDSFLGPNTCLHVFPFGIHQVPCSSCLGSYGEDHGSWWRPEKDPER